MKEREYDILNRLINSKYPIKLTLLSEEFDVSERTIRNDIVEINNFLESNRFSKVKNFRGKGFDLTLDDDKLKILRDLLQFEMQAEYLTRSDRMLDLLLGISLGTEPIFLNKKEDEFRVSKSTVDEDMRLLRQELLNYQVKIVSYPKVGLLLEGSELSIRSMLYDFLSAEVAKVDEGINHEQIIHRYLPKDMLVQLDHLFDSFISQKNDRLQELHFNLFVAVWVLRVKKGNLIQRKEIPVGDIEENEPIKQYIKEVSNKFSIQPTIHETDYVERILHSFNLKREANPVNWLQIQIHTLQLIQFVERETGVPFSKKEDSLQQSLYNHMISMISRVENHIQLSNPLKDKIIKNYGKLYRAVANWSSLLEDELGQTISEDELAFLTIHFSTILSKINQENTYIYRAVVVCNHGIATSRLLAENLKEFFNIEVVALLSSNEISIIDKLDADLIFSTIELSDSNKPVMVVDSIIQEDTKEQIKVFLDHHPEARRLVRDSNDFAPMFRDILLTIASKTNVDEDLYNDIANVFSNYSLQINNRKVQPMIQDILEDQHIQITNDEFDWKEAIKYAATPLRKENTIEDNYVQAMIQSVEEYGPYIVIAPHMALAHARPEEGANQLGLSLAIFQKPVPFGDDPEQQVSIVFCLSAVDSFSHLNVMKSLVNLIRKTDKIDQLSRARDIESVKKILFQP